MNVTVNIVRNKVMSVVEGISLTISQKNGGTPPMEQLWASEDERKKLDIYYREAINDLERKLTVWLKIASFQFDLEADGEDYTLRLIMSRHWPERLLGLLDNKVQDYLVHSVTAGWLNDFDGLNVKQDYTLMATNDLSDIAFIIMQKRFDFAEAARGDDADEKQDPDDAGRTTERREDWYKSEDGGGGEIRTSERKQDNEYKGGQPVKTPCDHYAGRRHQDDAQVCHRRDWTDWSGTHTDPHWLERLRRFKPEHGCNGLKERTEKHMRADDSKKPETIESIKHHCGTGNCPDHENIPLDWEFV